MNFELLDNLFQVSVLTCAAIASLLLAIRYIDRRLLILAFAYCCFSMGTLFFVLHIAITGDQPHIFYVSELSWIASYLFFLSLQVVRMEGWRVRFSVLPALCAGGTISTIVIPRMMGDSYLVSAMYAVSAAAIIYGSVFRLLRPGAHRALDGWFVVCVLLQMALYLISPFMTDFTHLNLYFVVDFVLTGAYVLLLPLTLREVKQR